MQRMRKTCSDAIGWRRPSTTSSTCCTISKTERAIVSSRGNVRRARASEKVPLGMAPSGCRRLMDSRGQTEELVHLKRWWVRTLAGESGAADEVRTGNERLRHCEGGLRGFDDEP